MYFGRPIDKRLYMRRCNVINTSEAGQMMSFLGLVASRDASLCKCSYKSKVSIKNKKHPVNYIPLGQIMKIKTR